MLIRASLSPKASKNILTLVSGNIFITQQHFLVHQESDVDSYYPNKIKHHKLNLTIETWQNNWYYIIYFQIY